MSDPRLFGGRFHPTFGDLITYLYAWLAVRRPDTALLFEVGYVSYKREVFILYATTHVCQFIIYLVQMVLAV